MAGSGTAEAVAPDPAAALAELRAGNQRFVRGELCNLPGRTGPGAGPAGQRPFAVVLGCIDSRVPVEAVFDQGSGAVLVARSAGQVLDRAVLGSVEFAVVDFAVPLVLVLGHTQCGAVRATIDAVRNGTRPGGARGYLLDQIKPAVRAAGEAPGDTAVARQHVRRTVARLRRREQLRGRSAAGALAVRGAVYHLDSGRVELLP